MNIYKNINQSKEQYPKTVTMKFLTEIQSQFFFFSTYSIYQVMYYYRNSEGTCSLPKLLLAFNKKKKLKKLKV